MANLISPAQINYGMDPNLALALQQRASTAGNIPQALGLGPKSSCSLLTRRQPCNYRNQRNLRQSNSRRLLRHRKSKRTVSAGKLDA